MWIIEFWWHRWKIYSQLMLYTKIVHNETEAIMKSHYAKKKKRYFQNFNSFSKSFELFKCDFITALLPLCIVGYWLLRNFLNQYQINLLPTQHPAHDVFCILFMIFFVCCLFVSAPSMMFDSLLKAGLLMIFRQTKLLHFWIWKLVFFFFSLLLSSNLIEFIIIFYEYRLIRNCHFYWPCWEKKT